MSTRTAFTRGLRQVADWLDEHPEVELPYLGRYAPGRDLPSLPIYLCGPDARTQLAAIARAMGHASKGPGWIEDEFIIWREFAGVVVFAQAARDEVCERVVVGQKIVTKQVPDPELLAAVPTVTVTETVDEVEWRCKPILTPEPTVSS